MEIVPSFFREVMGHYPTGVVLVTAMVDRRPVGMVMGNFSSVSLDPPLVSFMPSRSSRTHAMMRSADAYCVNVFAHDQLELCGKLARPSEHAWEQVDWEESALGAPQIADAVAYVDVTPASEVDAGDHVIALCGVHGMSINRAVMPLLFFQGGYGAFSLRGVMSAHPDSELVAAIRMGDIASNAVAELARDVPCEATVLVASGSDELLLVGSAYGLGVETRQALGERRRLIPPVGEAFVAHADENSQEKWLAQCRAKNEAPAVWRRERLARVRALGYAVEVARPGAIDRFHDLRSELNRYVRADITPAESRRVQSMVAELADTLEADPAIESTRRYDVANLSVPIHGPAGNVPMIVTLSQLPQQATGQELAHWIARLKDTATDIEASFQSGACADLQAYLTWVTKEEVGTR